MTLWGLYFFQEGFEIYSNFHFTRIPYKPLDIVSDFSEIQGERIALFLDEIHKSADSRDSFSPLNRFLTSDIMQHRKWGQDSHVFGSEQLSGLMDVRLRGIVSRVHMPKVIAKMPDLKWRGKIIKGKPLALCVESYLTFDPLERRTVKKCLLFNRHTFVADEYDTNQMIGKIGMNYDSKFIEQLKSEYCGVPLSKVMDLSEEIRMQEEKRKSYPSTIVCKRAARQILNDRVLGRV